MKNKESESLVRVHTHTHTHTHGLIDGAVRNSASFVVFKNINKEVIIG